MTNFQTVFKQRRLIRRLRKKRSFSLYQAKTAVHLRSRPERRFATRTSAIYHRIYCLESGHDHWLVRSVIVYIWVRKYAGRWIFSPKEICRLVIVAGLCKMGLTSLPDLFIYLFIYLFILGFVQTVLVQKQWGISPLPGLSTNPTLT